MLSFTLIGLYVGLIPVLLGMLWLPVLRRMSQVWMTFFTAVTIGLLIFLGIDATNEALEQARELGGAFQGVARDLTPGGRDAIPTSTTFEAGDEFAFSPDGGELVHTATPVPAQIGRASCRERV